ncbi:MAG: FmdB family zinc ribbon protein [Dissulfurimicrobium sp.]|uniref:FmdB family zinc ribbon protein n=1 Tax=Dissulfurimicrobium TaxID=1769732 RepID=UPI001ED9CF29|nr:FmdB family zinc ribbon protein [Dissulfurimicrobium hydrothermale]UKL12967.1 zinc ribbon domain-containing protein [Dissulfurimicrobium hydrothermale]
MPIYEYECLSCGRIVELMQRFTDPDPAQCKCGGRFRKLISNSSFHLKGTGWYVTDYKNRGGNNVHAASEADKPKTPAASPPATASSPHSSKGCGTEGADATCCH